MKLQLRTFASASMFAGILAGCLAKLLLVILMVRFPPLLIAVVLACWIYREQKVRMNP
ncbi:hypothetical protein [Stutzerimonas stutzeri]|uniref:hypothetical protein n=1 Tax=Stutzerimonas stutzeri TaxID=316 RepID=UPI0004B95AE5|nr:hypothetical protein [Stutzerimonas stutzeri]MCQ4330720.1 hypothetical protein [Stutzerimonas stutzeri]